jgi:RNA polymerase sigma factor (sigma-70 family)
VRKRLASSVRVRFAATLDALAARIVDLARGHGTPPEDFAARLSLDDLYLATACAGDEAAAWEEFGDRFFRFIRDFARRTVREPLAVDTADQVIADLWQRKKIARYEGRSTLRTWLGAVVAHAALNAGARERVGVPLDSPRSQAAAARMVADPHAGAGVDVARMVIEALRDVPTEDRLVLLLYYEQELTLEQIGRGLGLSIAAVSRRLKRARERVRASLDVVAGARFGTSADGLRRGVDLGRVEYDLAAALGGRQAAAKGNDKRGV